MFDNTKAGTYSITVMYGNAKDSFTVDVLDTEPASGDVNNDGNFVLSDVVLLQKYLIDVPDTNFVNWQAADFCKDGRLDVFDLVLMKKAVIETLNI
ncbi:MAG: dockerin type I repeat-containing protein [Ruminococcus sp.]|nr:dockerin type I repeat-containing protein [Ruminococcus sp.]